MKRFRKYWLVFVLSAQDLLQYRFDFFLHTTKYAITIAMMAVLWLHVGGSNNGQAFEASAIVPYYLMAAALFSLANFHTWYIEEDIRLGSLSKYLLKPISAFLYYGFHQAAQALTQTALKLAIILPLTWFLFSTATSFELHNVLWLLIFVPLVYVYSYIFFFTLSSLAFWFNEVFALRWAWMGVFRFLAGFYVPIHFFPDFWQGVFNYLPFQHLVYTPIQSVLGRIDTMTTIRGIGVLVAWAMFFAGLAFLVWRNGMKKYESTGI